MNVSKPELEGDVLVVEVEGRVDAVTTPQIEKILQGYLSGGQKKLLIDMQHVDYLSSAGMRLLLSLAKKLQSLQGKLVICSIAENVLEVIKMAGFHLILTIAPTRQAGLQSF